MTSRVTERFVVTEITGMTGITYKTEGLSCHVIDTAWNHRLCASFRTEDVGGTKEKKRAYARRRAAEKAAELNRKYGGSEIAA